jgi:WD40 repeat protein
MIRDQDEGVKVLKLKENTSTESLAFSPTGDRLAAGGAILEKVGDELEYDHGHLNLWETSTGRELFVGTLDRKPIRAISFSPDGNWLALVTGQTVMRWNTVTGSGTELLTIPLPAGRVAFSPSGNAQVVSAADKKLNVWDVTTGQEICMLEWQTYSFSCVGFGPNGELLASDYKTVKVWAPATGREIHSVDTGEDDEVCSVALSPDGKRLATGHVHGLVKVWKLAD